jgi:hypothetical protein
MCIVPNGFMDTRGFSFCNERLFFIFINNPLRVISSIEHEWALDRLWQKSLMHSGAVSRILYDQIPAGERTSTAITFTMTRNMFLLENIP